MDYSRYQDLAVSREDRVLTVTLNRPRVLNAMTYRMHRDLANIWSDIAHDAEVNAVVLTGAGRAFCAGMDLKLPDPGPEEVPVILDEARRIVRGMIELDKPVVAAINGVAVGGGTQLALLSDITVMAKDATLIDGHVSVGVPCGDHACLVWPLLCGMAKAKYYLFRDEPITGEEAERIGLVSEVAEQEQVVERAVEIARSLAKKSQYGLRGTKRAINGWLLQSWPIFEHSLAEEMAAYFFPDVHEARAAFREKREARFPSATRPDIREVQGTAESH